MHRSTDLLLYQTEDGDTRIDIRTEDELVWMNPKEIADFFQTSPQNIAVHIKNIYQTGELVSEKTCKICFQNQTKDAREVKQKGKHYNLEIIIAIGYRIRSHRGTQFRRWANKRLSECLIKGFTMDDDQLKDMKNFGQDYFDELLERISNIRLSKKRFHQKIINLYGTSVDYDVNSEITQSFFATVEDKFHVIIHDQIALTEKEVKSLDRIVTMYLDYAEDQAERQQPMHMNDWAKKLNAFLQFNEREILENAGKISKVIAAETAISQYEKYNQERLSKGSTDDFDEFVKMNDLK